MKKSVILLILVVFIASIMIVGFYGARTRTYDEVVQAEEIVCLMELDPNFDFDTATTTNPDYKDYKDGNGNSVSYVFTRQFYPQYAAQGLKITLKFGVKPENATNGKIVYLTDTPAGVTFTDNGDGSATFVFYDVNVVTSQPVVIGLEDKAAGIKQIHVIILVYEPLI